MVWWTFTDWAQLVVNAPDSDVTFRSSDNVLFHVHRRNLKTHAAAFPLPKLKTSGEVIELTEDSSILELLFQFMYPQYPPELEKVTFSTTESLAEAAEKYQAFSAIFACRVFFRYILHDFLCCRYSSPDGRSVTAQYPIGIFVYAVRHGQDELINKCAPFLLEKPLVELAVLPDDLFKRWVITVFLPGVTADN